jgi:hypothetical protein
MRYSLPFMLLMTLGSAAVTHAQSAEVRNVEIGVGAGGAFSWWVGGGAIAGGDVRVSVPATRRSMFEAIVAVTSIDDGQVAGIYGAQMRRRIGRREDPDCETFVTYGLVGAFVHADHGSVVTPPLIGLVGAGVQQRLADRLALRVEAQAVIALVIPVGARVAVGLSVPLGRLSGR